MADGKILLLSDGSRIFSVLDRFFRDKGYQTMTVDSNRGAARAIRTGDFQLLITRTSRNRGEALAILKSIRKNHPGLAVIILRGDHQVNSAIEAYHLEGGEEVFIPCGWPGLGRLVANCVRD